MNADADEMSKGLNQDNDGVRCPTGALPFPTLTRATTDRSTSSMVSSMPSSAFWKLAETSIPTVADVRHDDDPEDADQEDPAAGRVSARCRWR